jgi:hypothetical protein
MERGTFLIKGGAVITVDPAIGAKMTVTPLHRVRGELWNETTSVPPIVLR